MSELAFTSLEKVATHLRDILRNGLQRSNRHPTVNQVLLFAYNGTGKTRLSMAFKDLGKNGDERDTLYFNAYTEDLFHWDNDLASDTTRIMRLNRDSRFFNGLHELGIETRIQPLLNRYADFSIRISSEDWSVIFFRERSEDGEPLPIKVSRGEENIFVWCFYLAVAQLAIDEHESYKWVKYLYNDDPISSLDDNNAIAVASHLAQLLKVTSGKIKVVISTHHALFFNVMWNELQESRKMQPYFLNHKKDNLSYTLRYTNDTPFYHHIALLEQLHAAMESDQLYTYHFNILRSILEKTATFHGFKNFSACIKREADDPDGILHSRLINVLSHGNYSLFEPREMLEENKQYFRKILNDFMANYRFNTETFPPRELETIS